MAKLNGFELKNIKNFLGHEQEPLEQGSIYYKGKKVGFYSQDAHGGCDNIDLDYDIPQALKEEIYVILNSYKSDTIFRDDEGKIYDFKGGEYLFSELSQLRDYEKQYKKYCKKWGCTCIAFVKTTWCRYSIIGDNSREQLETKIQSKEEFKGKNYYIYTSLEDFNITTESEGK